MAKGKKSAPVIEAPSPSIDLPNDGNDRTPIGVKLRLSGACGRINRAHSVGDRFLVLAEVRTRRAGHEDTNDGLLWEESAKILDNWEIDGERAAELLVEMRTMYRSDKDQLTIDDELGDQRKAADGVALTPEEQKALEAFNGDVEAAAQLEAGRQDGEKPPFDGYETLGVGAIVNRLAQMNNRIDVLLVGAYEDAHKQRSGVLEAVTRRSAQLLAEGSN